MSDILFFERARAGHGCRRCKKPICKGEMRITRPSQGDGCFYPVYEHYCLLCAGAIITEESPHLRYAEENILRAYRDKVFQSEPEKYVANALTSENQAI